MTLSVLENKLPVFFKGARGVSWLIVVFLIYYNMFVNLNRMVKLTIRAEPYSEV